MKTLIFILLALYTLIFNAHAQKGQLSLSIGPSVGIPLNFSEGYKAGTGGGLRGYLGVTRQGSILANVNFLSFPTKFSGGGGAAKLTSVKLGYKTNFNSANLFIYGDGGLIIKGGQTGQSNSDLGIGSGIGYSVAVGKSGHIDFVPSFNIVFQNTINRSWLDLHLAYRFHP